MDTNKLYDRLKLIGQVVLNPLLALILVVLEAFGCDTGIVAKIGAGVITFYNAFIVLWNKEYKASQGEI